MSQYLAHASGISAGAGEGHDLEAYSTKASAQAKAAVVPLVQIMQDSPEDASKSKSRELKNWFAAVVTLPTAPCCRTCVHPPVVGASAHAHAIKSVYCTARLTEASLTGMKDLVRSTILDFRRRACDSLHQLLKSQGSFQKVARDAGAVPAIIKMEHRPSTKELLHILVSWQSPSGPSVGKLGAGQFSKHS